MAGLVTTLDAAQLRGWIHALESGLLERDAAARAVLLAAMAGEHVLLIGPPGTAKSELARRLRHAFADARYFERLLTRFSVPEELFGPLSLKALEADRYERLTEGYLPTASVAFLDEVFKANSAILNALLTLLNERQFDNGQGRLSAPLISLVGATNEVPADEALQAFYDRFLLRVPVTRVSDEVFAALLNLPSGATRTPSPSPSPLTLPLIRALHAQAETMTLNASALEMMQSARAQARAGGLEVSDRRWRQLARLLRVQAASCGREHVHMLDAWVVPYALADRAEPLAALQRWFVDDVMDTPPFEWPWLDRAALAFEQQLDIETRLPSAQHDAAQAGGLGDTAGKMAMAQTVGRAQGDGSGMARIVSATLEAKLRRHYSALHVQTRVAQVDDLLAPLPAQLQAWSLALAQLREQISEHAWLPPSVADELLLRRAKAVAQLQSLLERLQATRAGFAALPVDAALAAAEPAPVAWAP
jgi:MoxR-like ATPase